MYDFSLMAMKTSGVSILYLKEEFLELVKWIL
jgi:hypothetical protein